MGFGLEDLFRYGGGEISSEKGVIEQPETIDGTFEDIEMDGKEADMRGERDLDKRLKNLVLDTENRIFYVDDHQHALTGWLAAYYDDLLEGETALLHLDRHDDLVEPEEFEAPDTIEEAEQRIASALDNDEFIVPASQWELIDDWYHWGVDADIQTSFFSREFNYDSIILDLDLDVFTGISNFLFEKVEDSETRFEKHDYSLQMNYFYDKIAEQMTKSDFTTIATSPGYIHQDTALMHMGNIIERYQSKK